MKFQLILLAIVASLAFMGSAHAYNQSEACYSQCAAWKLVWQDDFAWGYVKEFCSADKKELSKEMVSMWADYVLSEVSFMPIMNAFVCADVINTYIAPELQACRNNCAQNDLYYAPNLYVSEDTVYYDGAGTLHITVRNGGAAYMPSANVAVYAGNSDTIQTPARMDLIANKTLKDFRPSDVRYTPENMEPERGFTVSWSPKTDKYNIVRVVITADPKIKEGSTRDNVYELVVNDLPEPASLGISGTNYVRLAPGTADFLLTTVVKNGGELTGQGTLKYYLGQPSDGNLVGEEPISISAKSSSSFEKEILFADPSTSYVTIVLEKDGKMVDEATVFMKPQFLLIVGKITDETGVPIKDAIVSTMPASNPDFPLSSGEGMATTTDETGAYRMPEYVTSESTVSIYAHKPGYSPNSTSLVFTYNESDSTGRYKPKWEHVDLTLLQNAGGVSVEYPARGWFIIETDKGRFTGEYAPNGTLPIQGNNGTVAIFSPLCSAYVSDFGLEFSARLNLTGANVKCLAPDSNDEYEIQQAPVEIWNKQYSGEEARMVAFSKNGKYAYVMTASTGTNFCTLYSYELATGNQKYRLPFNTACGQHSKITPAYDGSTVYAGVGSAAGSIKGKGEGAMYVVSENGEILYNFTKGDALDTLEHSSATSFTDIMADPGTFVADNYGQLEECMMIANRTCNPPGGKYSIDVLGISRNRVLGECDGKPCIFSLGKPEYLTLDSPHILNAEAEGNYVNDDVFVGNYQGGSYYVNGEPEWSVKRKIGHVSMSPGGKYVALSYDPYGIGVYLASGGNITPAAVKDKSVLGIAATERGIVYATHTGSSITFYRLSNFVEPTSSTTSGGATGSTSFTDFLFETIVGWYNAFIEYMHSWFGWI